MEYGDSSICQKFVGGYTMSKQSRTEARTEAFKIIFQMDMHIDELDYLFECLLAEKPESKRNIDYIKNVVNGVSEKNDYLQEIIQSNLGRGWKLNRISKVSLSVLKMAIYEMLYVDDVPANVAINEAIEIIKIYDEPERSSFVNGVLGGVYKNVLEKKD